VLSEFHPSPAVSEVEAACDVMRDHQLQGVIGFGGGSSLDVAKAVAMLQTNPLPVNQYAGMYKVPRKSAPLILIATTAGTGSEGLHRQYPERRRHPRQAGIQSKHILADISIADPELTISMPLL
jgi:alcohol dehydrogenase class IV